MISIVIPLYNEEELIQELYQRTVSAMESVKQDFEIICVDDGSTDSTYVRLCDLHNSDKRIKVISLSRNFGHQKAILAGLSVAKGDYTGIMDGDLQDPPEMFLQFFTKAMEGFDVVYGIRKSNREKLLKRFTSWLFYRVLFFIGESKIPVDSGDFCLMHKDVVTQILSMPEQSMFLRGIRSWVGFKQAGIKYNRDIRKTGKAKIGLRTMLQFAKSGLFSFSSFPIRFLGWMGMIIIAFSVVYACIMVYKKIFEPEYMPQGYTSLIIAIVFLSGVQLISLRILGEYIVRTYDESKKRPLYIIRNKHLE